MSQLLKCISPVDGSVYVERPLSSDSDIQAALDKSVAAQKSWRKVPLSEKQALISKAVDYFVANKADIAEEITWQIGRPISQSPGEIGGFEERARYMIEIAPQSLADQNVGDKEGFTRFIRKEALGVVFVVAPWNFPLMTAVNCIVPALLAGNTVLLKHAAQTPLCAERFTEAFKAAGLPDGVFQHLHMSHDSAAKLIGSDGVDFVNFTGSVPAGHAIQKAASGRFIATGLELGGKDPGYVRSDANIAHAIESLVDGAMFNSGQSCCGIERIYVHASVYDDFVSGAVELLKQYKLGNPTDTNTNLGPVVKTSAAEFVRGQVAEAVKAGAEALIDPGFFAANKEGTPYLAPQLVVGVDHSMRVMNEESFGPVVGVMKVSSDEEAINLMNDSEFGLTASIWTQDADAALTIGDEINTGTWFMNRCDYLDPALPWTGVKNSGRGCSLSKVAYEHLTRPKSFHLRTKV